MLFSAQCVTASLGLPSSFSWLEPYLDMIKHNLEKQKTPTTKRQDSNLFAKDVFDPLQYMNIDSVPSMEGDQMAANSQVDYSQLGANSQVDCSQLGANSQVDCSQLGANSQQLIDHMGVNTDPNAGQQNNQILDPLALVGKRGRDFIHGVTNIVVVTSHSNIHLFKGHC